MEREPLAGRVLTYDLDSGSTVVRVTGLDAPYGVIPYTNSTHTLYFVSNNYRHVIHIYDANWNYLSRFGGVGTSDGQLQYPRTLLISPEDTLWVADSRNNRVEEFHLDGTWRRHVLTQADGIERAHDMSYHPQNPDYLWVSYSTSNYYNVKRYKIY